MAQQLKVFVSHSHEDTAFCRKLVEALRQAGADVWYDEHNLGSGQLMEVIQRELDARPMFILILSKHAFASRWVKRETTWAYDLYDRDPSRLILPVTAAPIDRADFSGASGWLFLHDFKRIEAAGYRPLPLDEAAQRTLHALALTPAGEAPVPLAPQPSESADDLLARGKALKAQGEYSEALPLFQRATQVAAGSFDAWFNLGYTLDELKRYQEALPANERATALDATSSKAWNNKGLALYGLNRYQEALVAYDRAIALDPNLAFAWNNKGVALNHLDRNEEALVALDRALALDPNNVLAWSSKAATLHNQKRYNEALAAREQQLRIDPQNAQGWRYRAETLRSLGRTTEAEQAERRAKELGG